MLPSGPWMMDVGPTKDFGSGTSVTLPDIVMKPILLALFSVNHMFPSRPAAIEVIKGRGLAKVCTLVIRPFMPIRAIESFGPWMMVDRVPTHRFPSGPLAIATISNPLVPNTVTAPVGLIRTMSDSVSVSQRLPSGPSTIVIGQYSLGVFADMVGTPALLYRTTNCPPYFTMPPYPATQRPPLRSKAIECVPIAYGGKSYSVMPPDGVMRPRP